MTTIIPRPLVAPTEVQPRPKRRSFSADYRVRILAEAEAAVSVKDGIGALLRRKGLHFSHQSPTGTSPLNVVTSPRWPRSPLPSLPLLAMTRSLPCNANSPSETARADRAEKIVATARMFDQAWSRWFKFCHAVEARRIHTLIPASLTQAACPV